MVEHPAGHDPALPLPLFEKIYGEAVVAFRENRTLGIRKVIVFEAATPRLTRSRAYASPASLPRPSQGSLPARAGSPLAGRDLHPLDDESKFHEVIAVLQFPSTSRAWSHYSPYPRGFSMTGMIALTGVVINDALVLLDRANRMHAEGLEWCEAMLEAGATRFRAIVLTSLTTFFGLLPLLFERSAQAAWLKPMAVTLGFGVVFATVITLVLIPAAWIWMLAGVEWTRTIAIRARRSGPDTAPVPVS